MSWNGEVFVAGVLFGLLAVSAALASPQPFAKGCPRAGQETQKCLLIWENMACRETDHPSPRRMWPSSA